MIYLFKHISYNEFFVISIEISRQRKSLNVMDFKRIYYTCKDFALFTLKYLAIKYY